MNPKHLDGRRKGEYSYDYEFDILLFKAKDRDYAKSVDFENLTVDIDTEGFVMGIRIFDASTIFGLSKIALSSIKNFELTTKVEEGVINLQLKFKTVLRNKAITTHGHNFVREALGSHIQDSESTLSI